MEHRMKQAFKILKECEKERSQAQGYMGKCYYRPRREEEDNGTETICGKLMADKWPKLIKYTKPQAQEVLQMLH